MRMLASIPFEDNFNFAARGPIDTLGPAVDTFTVTPGKIFLLFDK